MSRLTLISFAVLAAACGSHATSAPSCAASEQLSGDTCVPRFDACADTEVPLAGGGCAKTGVPEGGCGVGFQHDGVGCTAILPDTPCAPGTFALPGELACHDVAPCPASRWGDAPDSAVHVDAGYSGGANDGSAERPFTTVAAAIAAAPDGATIAITDGVYREALSITRPVTLVGRCPSKVTLDSPDDAAFTLDVQAKATLRHLGVRGPAIAVSVFETTDVLVDECWLHDAGNVGLDVERREKKASATLRRSLVERVAGGGVVGIGASVTVVESVVRDVTALSKDQEGQGVLARPQGSEPGALSVVRSLVERVVADGIASGTALTVEDTLIRGVSDAAHAGIGVLLAPLSAPGAPPLDARSGSIARTVIENVAGAGLLSDTSSLVVDRTVVRSAALPRNPKFDSTGMAVQHGTLAISASVVEHMLRGGIGATAGSLTVTDTLLRDVAEGDTLIPRGLGIVGFQDLGEPVTIVVQKTRIAGARTVGIYAEGGSLDIKDCAVSSITDYQGGFGDGLSAAGDPGTSGDPAALVRTSVHVDGLFVTGVARAGVSFFGGVDAAVARMRLSCNAFDLEVTSTIDPGVTADVHVDDRGGSSCGCGDALAACHAEEAAIAPLPSVR